MKILFMILMTILLGTFYQDKSNIEKSPGFYVEIRNDSEPGIIKEVFIDMISIRELPIDSVSIKDSEGKPDREWIGVNLCLMLEKKLNLSCNQIKKISISAPDGYVSVISGELLSALETGICAFGIKGEANWPKKYGYMRLLFSQLRAMYWVNSPSKMIIELGEAQQASERFEFYFMDSENFKSLIRKDLKGNPYIAIDDILIELGAPQQSFRIMTQDSLFREYGANDINRRLVLQREPSGTWKMTGIAVPLGLKTRKIFLITTQNKALFLKPFSADEQEIFYTNYLQHIV
ncbi:MAG: hypothetical protein MUC94_18665, partial [bacterium]|nr:hypothetical protein [bacterium]